ncbi:MAG: class I SAM-dependent methyltransferase [Actinobacteria bacterium]|nr:class I SAM-dependent methyltransferase [Actinomycetota bacterium]
MLEKLGRTRDRVLDNVHQLEGRTLLDVGCGDGLIAFGALERGAAEVVFSDISADLLEACRELATELGVLGRCRFLLAPADELSDVADSSVDAVTTRSVLIYVRRKQDAFAEFFRVLRPGGRVSVWEPINRFGSGFRTSESFWGYETSGLDAVIDKLDAVFAGLQPDDDPMLDFDERDLLELAERAGFTELHLELRADVEPMQPRSWQTFLHTSGNPKLPTLAEAMDRALTPAERRLLAERLAPAVEAGRGTHRLALASLWAVKP